MPAFELSIPKVEDAHVQVDGFATESAWDDALVIDDFVTFQPQFGGVPSGRTVIRLMTDDRGFYLHCEATDPEPDKIRANLGRRDTRFGDDWCAIYLDPAGEAQRSYLFATNALGVQMDGTNVSGAPEDMSWDGRWSSAGRRTPTGYEVEIAVPWRSIRHPADAAKMGVFVFRKVGRTGEKSSWPKLDPNVNGLIVQEGIIDGPGELPRTVGLDLIPELTFDYTDQGPAADRLGWHGVSPGLTAKWAPVPALQLLATVNPDFSQVESDSAQIGVNRRYALYYQEKRPFFLEGQEWFSHPMDGLLYTRSMVAPVYGSRATAEADAWTLAALNVVDRRPAPSVAELGGWTVDDLEGHDAVETIARVRKAVGEDRFVGAVFSDRSVLGTRLTNRVGGFDAHIRLTDAVAVTGTVLGSQTTFTDGRTRFAPATTGWADIGSTHVDSYVWWQYSHPDFRAENGFVTTTDEIGGGGGTTLKAYPKSEVLPSLSMGTEYGALADHTGRVRWGSVDPNVTAQLGNGVFAWADGSFGGERYVGEWLGNYTGDIGIDGQWTDWLAIGASAYGGQSSWYDPEAPDVGLVESSSASIGLQPFSQLSISASMGYERFVLHGTEAYSGAVSRLRVEAFPTRRVWARAIIDRSSFDTSMSGEGLIAWEHSPGSAVYVGGGRFGPDPLAKAPQDVPSGWEVFAKGSWVLAI